MSAGASPDAVSAGASPGAVSAGTPVDASIDAPPDALAEADDEDAGEEEA
jgi:hypothetical protein